MMRRTTQWTALGLVATLGAGLAAPMTASADSGSRQANKNLWRNLAIGGAAVAGYGLFKHNTTATVLGAAGAAYSANRYEQDRHSQDQAKRARERYHRRLRLHRYSRYHRRAR